MTDSKPQQCEILKESRLSSEKKKIQSKILNIENEMSSSKANIEGKLSTPRRHNDHSAQKGRLILPKIKMNARAQRESNNKSVDNSKGKKKGRTYIKLFRSAIINSMLMLYNAWCVDKSYLPNYLQCLNEINKEFYITGTALNVHKNEQEECLKILKLNPSSSRKLLSFNLGSNTCKAVGAGANKSIDNKLKQIRLSNQEKEDLKRLREIQEKQEIAQAKRKRAQRRLRLLKNCMKYLLSNGVNIQAYVNQNPFPLKPFSLPYSESFISAVKFNNLPVVKEALELNKAYLFEYDYFKQTCFHWAAKLGYAELLKYLLSKGKCCNVYDDKLRTPIYLAALNNQRECCEILLQHRANLDFSDRDGRKPSDVVTEPQLRLLLLDHLENPNLRGSMLRDD